MTIALFDRVWLTHDIPDEGLRRGDVAVVVDRVTGEELEDGYIIEVFNAVGQTVKVVDIPESAVAPLTADELPSVRPMAPVASAP